MRIQEIYGSFSLQEEKFSLEWAECIETTGTNRSERKIDFFEYVYGIRLLWNIDMYVNISICSSYESDKQIEGAMGVPCHSTDHL